MKTYPTILIACGASKLPHPAPAYQFYTGSLFQTMLKVATSLSPKVKILSAGYGLVGLNDILAPYDIKMTPIRAKRFKDLKVVECLEATGSLLPAVYLSACSGEITPLISPRLSIGQQLQAALALLEPGAKCLVDFSVLEKGSPRELLALADLRQQNRTGPVRNVCAFVGDTFAQGYHSLFEVNALLESKFGPALGLNYLPTIRRQLYVQAEKRGATINTIPVEGTRLLKYCYVWEAPKT